MRDEEVREEEPPTELIDADDVVRDEIPAKEPEGLGTIVAGDIELDYS